MDNIKGLVAMQIAPLELVNDNIDPDKVKVTRLLSSSDESWLMQDNINLNPMFITPPTEKDEMKSYDLAFLLEGEFTSFFKGKTIPEQEEKEEENGENKIQEQDISQADQAGDNPAPTANKALKQVVAENTFLETSKPAKLFVLPCSQMLQDNMLDPQGRSTNSTFILNIVDHLNGDDAVAQLRGKQQTLNPIADTTPFARGLIKGFNIIGLPVLVILFGLGVLIKRTARKKKIENRFNA
jgi:ABC-type uncharacterized transport system involved in gliding motility auxiliary subunit